MKKIIIYVRIFYCFLPSMASFSQEYPALDIYGANMVFKELILTDKCDCCCGAVPKAKKCSLYLVEITDVFLLRDTSVYKEIKALKSISFIVLPSIVSEYNIKTGDSYAVFATNSCHEKFIVATKVLPQQPDTLLNYANIAYVTGLGVCKKFSLLQKLQLSLGIRRESIYRKAQPLPSSTSKYVMAIEEYFSKRHAR